MDFEKSKDLLQCLRDTENYVGWFNDCLIISSPDTMDFLVEPMTGLAQIITQNFPDKTIFATYYYSVTEAQGVCKIVNGSTEVCLFTPEINPEIGNRIGDLQDNFMLNQFGLELSGIFGSNIKMTQFNSINMGKCL